MAMGELRGVRSICTRSPSAATRPAAAARRRSGAHKRNFPSPPGGLSDPLRRIAAFLGFSPQQPGNSGFFDTRFKSPAATPGRDVQRPMLTATGDGDDGCKPVPTSPAPASATRRTAGASVSQRMPASGDKYHLYVHDADAFHMLFELNAKECPDEERRSRPSAPRSCAGCRRRALAFLDGHVRQLPAAVQWLQSTRIEQASRGVAEWQRK